MAAFDHITSPTSMDLLIGFTDIRGFLRIVKRLETSEAAFAFLDRLAFLSAEVVERGPGRILKFIGDASLIVYPGELADAAVRNLMDLKDAADEFLASEGFDTHIVVAAHVGEALLGPFGPEQRLDAFGESVNRAAVAERGAQRSAFVITPEAFRRLEPATRKRFRKHTPPILYMARD